MSSVGQPNLRFHIQSPSSSSRWPWGCLPYRCQIRPPNVCRCPQKWTETPLNEEPSTITYIKWSTVFFPHHLRRALNRAWSVVMVEEGWWVAKKVWLSPFAAVNSVSRASKSSWQEKKKNNGHAFPRCIQQLWFTDIAKNAKEVVRSSWTRNGRRIRNYEWVVSIGSGVHISKMALVPSIGRILPAQIQHTRQQTFASNF